MDYDNRGLEVCKTRLINWGCEIDEIVDNFIYAHCNSMKILYYTNWQDNYIPGNRGGSLPIEEPIRDYPCTEPQYFVGINYDGTISPCCNIRNDIEHHKPFILGDLNKDCFESIALALKRYNFISYCEKVCFDIKSPCYRCSNKGGRYTRENGGIRYE